MNQDIKFIKGVGTTRVCLLNKIGINTLNDIITYYPRNYEDRSKIKAISEVEDGQEALIQGVITSRMSEIRIKKNMTIYKIVINDGTGTCILTWFNQPYLKAKFKIGEKYSFFGKVSKKGLKIEMNSPVFDSENINKNTGKIIPIYPLTYNLSQNVFRQIMENSLNSINEEIEETLPQYLLDEYKLVNKNKAIKDIHFPQNFSDYNKARKRLVFEELLEVQMGLLNLKNKYNLEQEGIEFHKEIKISEIIKQLPFTLTKAQLKVLQEIDNDMESKKAMNRLLQGDVGSGKTIVSMIAAYKCVKSGYQATIMAPTSILATQHLESFKDILQQYDINVELLISSIPKKRKEEILEELKEGKIDILIGTHAILEENVEFKNLGLVVTDEQHRFGVRQRAKIVAKGMNPDVLVMTATPIPRTLALILYGDLDISIIDELPPNRKEIKTLAISKDKEDRLNEFVKDQIREGRQIYVVCSLVEENEEIEARSVLEIYEQYKDETFKEFKVAYIYGKMKSKEKDEIMQNFKDGKIDMLISTTVIEVGVNVPNASIMIVENAERFGLSQLHQLRGRVGRGQYQSYCVLKYEKESNISKKRMEIMQSTNDGFKIAEKDLEIRGTGEFFGTKQHGLPEFKIANLFEDVEILKSVQSVVIKILEQDKNLEKGENFKLREMLQKKFGQRIEI